MLSALSRWKPSPRVIAILCWLLVVLCMGIDHTLESRYDFNFVETSLYLVPITIASWASGSKVGAAVMLPAWIGETWLNYVQIGKRFPNVIKIMEGLTIATLVEMTMVVVVVSNLRSYVEKYRHFATVDELTGCLNVRAFRLEGTLAVERLKRAKFQKPLSVLFIDVDDFKLVNDKLGHLAGDDALRTLGSVLRKVLRIVDVVGRIGGDEFAVLLPDTPAEMVPAIVERIHSALREVSFPTTVSIGHTTYPPGIPGTLDDVLRYADGVMYEKKRNRRSVLKLSRAES